MRKLYKQFLDGEISRRDFLQELTLLGISATAAGNFLADPANAAEHETEIEERTRAVTGNGSDLLAESLIEADVEYIFHGCGGGINRFFDSFVTRPKLKNLLATHEGQCVAMAEGYHLASGGKLGVVIIPRPGLPNASGNLLNAMSHRSSILVLTARESNRFSNRRGNIEVIEWGEAMEPFMKWHYKMQHIERVPEFTRRAIKVSNAPLGGPTFLGMAEDLYEKEATAEIASQDLFSVQGRIEPEQSAISEVAKKLLKAKKPLIIAGLEVSKSEANRALIDLAEMLAIPVTQGLSLFADFPNQHPLSLGLFSRYLGYTRGVDLLIIIGAQMPDEGHYIVTGPPPEGAEIVHISMDPELLAMSQLTDISIVADAGAAIDAITDSVKSQASKREIRKIRDAQYQPIVEYIQKQRDRAMKRAKRSWDKPLITNARLSTELDQALDNNAIVCSESLFGVPEWFNFGPDAKLQLGPQPGEVLGWATGVATGAKLAQPDRQVVALSGDGAFMFGNNLWAIARYDAAILMVIYNNRAYNMNRAFGWLRGGAQAEMKKDMLTYLGDPDVDFTLMAKAHGIDGEIVEGPENLTAAISRGLDAQRNGKAYLLDVHTERWGAGGEFTWHPELSIAEMS
ncbi:MAG: thiamine pyrophosphate-dependent enzyme [Pseudomonadota bacterium]|nr:thiamine pyrophosphate-dependent enzyme [Pseudomonadota bacterium]